MLRLVRRSPRDGIGTNMDSTSLTMHYLLSRKLFYHNSGEIAMGSTSLLGLSYPLQRIEEAEQAVLEEVVVGRDPLRAVRVVPQHRRYRA